MGAGLPGEPTAFTPTFQVFPGACTAGGEGSAFFYHQPDTALRVRAAAPASHPARQVIVANG